MMGYGVYDKYSNHLGRQALRNCVVNGFNHIRE